MKKKFVVALILILVTTLFSGNAFALKDNLSYNLENDPDKVIIQHFMNEYQKVTDNYTIEQIKNNIKNLREWGMPEEKLETITLKEIQAFIRDLGNNVSNYSSEESVNSEENKYIIDPEIEIAMKEKGLSSEEMNLLCNLSYSPKEIINMTDEKINEILSAYEPYFPVTRSTHTYYGTIPYFGESDNQCDFDSSVSITSGAIDIYCEKSKEFAEYVLDTDYNDAGTYSEQNIRFSYFLWGEAGPGIHEGVDVRNVDSPNCDILSAHVGEIGNRGGDYGVVQIYDETMYSTITYMHMSNITGASEAYLGSTLGTHSNVTGGAPIEKHLHVQVETGENYYIATGTNTTLESSLPYYVMCWNI